MRAKSFELTTERLQLRPIEPADAASLLEVYADPEVTAFLKVLDLPGCQEQADRFAREWDERGHGILAVIDAATGQFLGRSGLHYWPDFGETEVGWVLRRDAWGRGYATEAGAASLRWGFEEIGLDLITAIIAKQNQRSIAVAERLGMTPYRDDELFGWSVTVYAKRRVT